MAIEFDSWKTVLWPSLDNYENWQLHFPDTLRKLFVERSIEYPCTVFLKDWYISINSISNNDWENVTFLYSEDSYLLNDWKSLLLIEFNKRVVSEWCRVETLLILWNFIAQQKHLALKWTTYCKYTRSFLNIHKKSVMCIPQFVCYRLNDDTLDRLVNYMNSIS